MCCIAYDGLFALSLAWLADILSCYTLLHACSPFSVQLCFFKNLHNSSRTEPSMSWMSLSAKFGVGS